MSDTFAIRRYHRQTMPALGVNRNKKYLRFFLLLLLAGAAVTGYLVYSSGILADSSPLIPGQLIDRINLERQANNLAPVQADEGLAGLALATSREVQVSALTYAKGTETGSSDATNVFVIPKIAWAISGYDAQQQMFDTLENEDHAFRSNVLNGGFSNAGIGVTSDGYNYYIAVKWG